MKYEAIKSEKFICFAGCVVAIDVPSPQALKLFSAPGRFILTTDELIDRVTETPATGSGN